MQRHGLAQMCGRQRTVVLPWVEAALTPENLSADALLETRFRLQKEQLQTQISAGLQKAGGAVRAHQPDGHDIKLNTMLRDYLLADSE